MVECTRSRDGRHHWNEFRPADVMTRRVGVAAMFGYCEFRVSCYECGVVTKARAIFGTRELEVRAVTTDQFFRRGR